MEAIDVNCDMGEGYGAYTIGQDEQIMPYITSCNIACGFHGGDPVHIENTIQLALKNNVRIGAHPSYPDLQGFGRRPMKIKQKELKAILKYQIAALKGLVESNGGKLSYVKPHGTLYTTAVTNEEEATTIIEAIQSIDSKLAFMGFAGSVMEIRAKKMGIEFIAEAFADRRYEPNGYLMSRIKPEALITNAELAVEQVKNLVLYRKVETANGASVAVVAESVCVHGDNPAAVDIVKGIRDFFINH